MINCKPHQRSHVIRHLTSRLSQRIHASELYEICTQHFDLNNSEKHALKDYMQK
jgi:hypothetical protein